jgi:predicted Ser/Thr protein kinase
MNQLIDRICDDFEAAWQQGEPLRIETLLQQSDAQSRDDLLEELLRLEVSLRQTAGQRPQIEDYAGRFPDHLHLIQSTLSISPSGDTTFDPKVAQYEVTMELEGLSPPTNKHAAIAEGTASSPSDKTIRKSVGRYMVVGTLGSGGQADVYRAVHPTLPIEVAVKLTHTTLPDKTREALREEAHILCDLDHPHIARIRDFDFDDGHPFMVLDFIRGRSLGQVAAAEPFSPEAAASIVAKIARAIGFAHSRGIIHRDLKPDNIVIDTSGEPKIIDFGMSRLRSGISGVTEEANEVSGTLAYMSPEQAEGITAKTDHRVDIFALGAILYRLLVGKAPYPPLRMAHLLQCVRQGDWDRDALNAADVPESLKAICHRAMATGSSERFGNASELAAALDKVVLDRNVPAVEKARVVTTPIKQWAVLGALAAIAIFAYLAIRPTLLQPSAVATNTTLANAEPIAAGELIRRFDIVHIGNSGNRAEFSGSLLQFRPPRENDDIQVQAEFNDKVYCFLVALNPDGVKQLCFPADADMAQSEPIKTLRYPTEEDSAFGLTDGIGQQAFVLYTSREPLPAFNTWNSELVAASWPNPDVSGNWQYREGQLEAIEPPPSERTRGAERKTKTPTPFKQICDRMREAGSTDVRGVLFEVKPKP